jgi:hypothetical protein
MSRKPFLLRIDEKLYEELEAWSQHEMRSVNGQIEYLLRQAVLKRKSAADLSEALPPSRQRAKKR